METYCWEEDFTDDRLTLTKDGVKIGRVERVGASWKVVYGSEIIAIRPDRASAQAALNKYHVEMSNSVSVRMKCKHEHLDMDGICHACGADRRGI